MVIVEIREGGFDSYKKESKGKRKNKFKSSLILMCFNSITLHYEYY